MDFLAAFHIFRGVPAADAFALKSVIESLGKSFVLVGIANKDRIVLDGFVEKGGEIFNKNVGETASA
jgi:hypothetical protein